MSGTASTRPGRRRRERMLAVAADLFHHRGVHATSVDHVLAATGTGKGQFYHYFGSKGALVREVVAYHAERVVTSQLGYLRALDSWEGIRAWFDYLVDTAARDDCAGGCPLGTLAAELADSHADLRADLARALGVLEAYLAEGLARMRAEGRLRGDADVQALARFVIAAQQGGVLLAKTTRDAGALRTALDQAYAHLRGFAAAP